MRAAGVIAAAVALAIVPASSTLAAELLVAHPSGATASVKPGCDEPWRIGRFAPSGRFSFLAVPGRPTSSRIGGGRGGLAAAWASNGVIRSAFLRGSRVGKPIEHGASAKGGLAPDVGVDPRGNRWVVWEAPEGVRVQRVSAQGAPGPSLLVGTLDPDDGSSPVLLAMTRDGSTWVAWTRASTTPVVVRIGPDNRVMRSVLPTSEAFGHEEISDGLPDGRGGLFALRTADNDFSDVQDPSASGGFTGFLDLIHVTKNGRVRVVPAARTENLTALGRLLMIKRSVLLVYEDDRGIYTRTPSVSGSLASPKLLRRTGDLHAVTSGPLGGSIWLLIHFERAKRERLAVQRFTATGKGGRAKRIVRGARDRDGEPDSVVGQALGVDGRGRAYVVWSEERFHELGSGYLRVLHERRVTPRRRLWRCR